MTVRPLPSSWLDEPVTAGAPPDHPGFSLPVGTVTFLLTDVEGSTRVWEEHPDAMREALVQHDAIVESLTEQHHGAVVRPRAGARTAEASAPAQSTHPARALAA